MKIHRFIIEKINLVESANRSQVVADKQLTHQMKTVLKLKPDDRIVIADGRGLESDGRIIRYARDGVEIHFSEVNRRPSAAKRKIVLYCSILKRENFEFAVEKATETGAAEIVPVISEKTVKTGVNLSRLKRIAKEAAEQSGRATLPLIVPPVDFKNALALAGANDVNFIFIPGAKEINLGGLPPAAQAGIFIGPEGGWSETERYMAEANGVKSAGLGPMILRAETAAVVSVFILSRL